jgi:hypothetical protein
MPKEQVTQGAHLGSNDTSRNGYMYGLDLLIKTLVIILLPPYDPPFPSQSLHSANDPRCHSWPFDIIPFKHSLYVYKVQHYINKPHTTTHENLVRHHAGRSLKLLLGSPHFFLAPFNLDAFFSLLYFLTLFFLTLSYQLTMTESRTELVIWVNNLLALQYTKVEQLGTGNVASSEEVELYTTKV